MRQPTFPVRVFRADHERIFSMCIEADQSSAEVVRDLIARADSSAEKIRYLEIDRAGLIRERNELKRQLGSIVKLSARKSVTVSRLVQ